MEMIVIPVVILHSIDYIGDCSLFVDIVDDRRELLFLVIQVIWENST